MPIFRSGNASALFSTQSLPHLSPSLFLLLLMALLHSYYNYMVLFSDNIRMYVRPSSAQGPCSLSFVSVHQLKFNPMSRVCCPFTGSMVCLDFLILHISHAQPANCQPHSTALTIIDSCPSDTSTTCPPREHLRPSILELITWDPGGLLRLFVYFFPCTWNIANLFLVFPSVRLPHPPFSIRGHRRWHPSPHSCPPLSCGDWFCCSPLPYTCILLKSSAPTPPSLLICILYLLPGLPKLVWINQVFAMMVSDRKLRILISRLDFKWKITNGKY